MLVLGIETTCDETAAAVVSRDEDGRGKILSNIVLSQTEHETYGGVVPEIAARAHVEALDTIITRAMIDANQHQQGIERYRGESVSRHPVHLTLSIQRDHSDSSSKTT